MDSAKINAASVLGAFNGSHATVSSTPRLSAHKPAIRWLRDEPCESCDRRTSVAIFDSAAPPCPRLCADCMRAAMESRR